jgi:membrane protein implicated in regulation of membrane protease activity
MRPLTKLLLVRSVIAFVVGVLAIVAFANGQGIFGALLAGLAITNVVLIAVFASRQRRSRDQRALGDDQPDAGTAQG